MAMAIRTINLSELQGELNKRGRDRYENAELKEMCELLINGEIPHIVWDELFTVTAKTSEKEVANLHAKWRNRAVSVFDSIESGKKASITWSDAHEMVITLAAQ